MLTTDSSRPVLVHMEILMIEPISKLHLIGMILQIWKYWKYNSWHSAMVTSLYSLEWWNQMEMLHWHQRQSILIFLSVKQELTLRVAFAKLKGKFSLLYRKCESNKETVKTEALPCVVFHNVFIGKGMLRRTLEDSRTFEKKRMIWRS